MKEKTRQNRLSELMKERETIEKDIEAAKREYDDFQKSEEFVNTSDTLEKVRQRKNEIAIV